MICCKTFTAFCYQNYGQSNNHQAINANNNALIRKKLKKLKKNQEIFLMFRAFPYQT